MVATAQRAAMKRTVSFWMKDFRCFINPDSPFLFRYIGIAYVRGDFIENTACVASGVFMCDLDTIDINHSPERHLEYLFFLKHI